MISIFLKHSCMYNLFLQFYINSFFEDTTNVYSSVGIYLGCFKIFSVIKTLIH